VHHDAERAVIAIGLEGVNVSDLDDRQERKQEQAQDGGGRESARCGPVIRPSSRLNCPQQMVALVP
jgi:hypothetical protein